MMQGIETLIPLERIYTFLGVFMAICIFVIAAIMLDLWDGVHTARVTHQRVHSHKLRVTIDKMCEYWRFLMIGFLVDCVGFLVNTVGMFESFFYFAPFIALMFGLGLIVVEIKSMFEHADKRRSSAVQLPDIIKSIVDCAHEKDARRLIEQLRRASQVEIESKTE